MYTSSCLGRAKPARLPFSFSHYLSLPLIATSVLAAAEPEPSGTQLRLIDISSIIGMSVGGTTADEHEMEWSQVGGHDPSGDGFTFQYMEVSLAGAVDPYFTSEAHLNITPEHGLELEEAFIRTTSLPYSLEVEAGYMLTEFGRYNPQHAHVQAFVDTPLVIGSLLGSEGMRDFGIRAAYLLPTSWYSQLHLSIQNGDDESMVSFLGAGHTHEEGEEEEEHHEQRDISNVGDMLYSLRWENALALSEETEIKFGLSLATGPNPHDEHTVLSGLDLTMKWYLSGSQRITWTSEYIYRQAAADEADEEHTDWGLVSELVYAMSSRWQMGLRYGMVDLENDADAEDPPPAQRFRLSPLIGWQPSEFSKIRMQYNYTETDEDATVSSFWLNGEVLIGNHPAHTF